MKFKAGDRVRAVNNGDVGTAFRGLSGTVVQASQTPGLDPRARYLVNFDTPPNDDWPHPNANQHQGGYWSETTLEWDDVTPEEEAAAIQSIVGLPPYCGPTQMHDPQGCDCGEAGS